MESQIRHEHPLDFVKCEGAMSEYVCKLCAFCFYQFEDQCQ